MPSQTRASRPRWLQGEAKEGWPGRDSEDVRNKLSNVVASQAVYRWQIFVATANASIPTPAQSKPAPSLSPATTTITASTGTAVRSGEDDYGDVDAATGGTGYAYLSR